MDCKEMIVSDDFLEVLLDYPKELVKEGLEGTNYCILELLGEYRILYLDKNNALPLSVSDYRYAYIPKCYGLLSPLPRPYMKSGVTAVQRPPLALTGEGIIIGFVDTGIRYQMEEFWTQSEESKIISIWDQTFQEGRAPEGLKFGTEYTREELEYDFRKRREGREGEIFHDDESGHGTALASVALNAAPGAEIVMVKCRRAKPYLKDYYKIDPNAEVYAETDIMAGLTYLEKVAERENKPLVICFSMGTNMGDHTGGSLLSRYLEFLGNGKRRCVVVGGGNEGNLAHHYRGRILLSKGEEYEDVEIRVDENIRGFSFELWGEIPTAYSIALRAPDGEFADRIPIRYGRGEEITFLYGGTIVDVSYVLVERTTGSELVFVRFTNPTPGIWTLRVFAQGGYGESNYDIWLPMEEFLERPVYFLRPDPYHTMTEPSYSEVAIGHSYYDSSNDSFAAGSGRGKEILRAGDKEITPALSVAGVGLKSLIGDITGSGGAAALMSGAAAQFMEWAILRQKDPLLSSMEIRNYFIRGAQRRDDMEYPNPLWGYGIMNIEEVFRKLVED